MRVFVAGAGGAVGRPVVRELVERGHSVVAMTASASKLPALEELGASGVAGDVFDARAMVELVRSAEPEGVVNVASKWSVTRNRERTGVTVGGKPSTEKTPALAGALAPQPPRHAFQLSELAPSTTWKV